MRLKSVDCCILTLLNLVSVKNESIKIYSLLQTFHIYRKNKIKLVFGIWLNIFQGLQEM